MESKNIHNIKDAAGTIYGLVTAILAMLLLSFIASGAVYFSSLPESSLYVMAVIINIVSLFVGGIVAGRKGKTRGLLRGLIVGVVVLALMVIFGSLPLSQLTLKAGYCLPAAALGGVCGIK